MSWADKPTDNQIGAFFNMAKWELPNDLAKEAAQWIEAHFTRKEMSEELGRVRKLYIEHKLNRESCFDSPAWQGFKVERRKKW